MEPITNYQLPITNYHFYDDSKIDENGNKRIYLCESNKDPLLPYDFFKNINFSFRLNNSRVNNSYFYIDKNPFLSDQIQEIFVNRVRERFCVEEPCIGFVLKEECEQDFYNYMLCIMK